jgi:tRNA pseudouridine32 synthase/23S rRNA pseudouridine746 synthase
MPRSERQVPLPPRDGVAASCVALPHGPWLTVATFLADRFPRIEAADWAARMARGEVVDERGRRVAPNDRLRAHRKLYYYRELAVEPPLPVHEEIVFQDEHLVVVDKPHFLPVVPSGRYLQETVVVRARRRLGIDDLIAVHRLDRETAGLVMLAVRPQDRDAYHAIFRDRGVDKEYEAVAPWHPDRPVPPVRRSRLAERADAFMQMVEVPGEPNAETGIELIRPCGPELGLYRLRPVTGQRHQLRVHMAALGMPLVGDRIYPVLQPFEEDRPDLTDPLQLLARRIAFTDPVTGQRREFESRRVLSGAVFGHDAQTDEGDAL